jgi:hypothetical protein
VCSHYSLFTQAHVSGDLRFHLPRMAGLLAAVDQIVDGKGLEPVKLLEWVLEICICLL